MLSLAPRITESEQPMTSDTAAPVAIPLSATLYSDEERLKLRT